LEQRREIGKWGNPKILEKSVNERQEKDKNGGKILREKKGRWVWDNLTAGGSKKIVTDGGSQKNEKRTSKGGVVGKKNGFPT